MDTRIASILAVILVGATTNPLAAQAKKCPPFFGPMVPDTTTARAIAMAIIRSHQRPEQTRTYILRVARNVDGDWEAFQDLPSTSLSKGNTKGGGGFQMVIDRCDGRVSEVSLQE